MVIPPEVSLGLTVKLGNVRGVRLICQNSNDIYSRKLPFLLLLSHAARIFLSFKKLNQVIFDIFYTRSIHKIYHQIVIYR